MKLYHGKYVIPALALFLTVATFPIWYGVATGGPTFENKIEAAEGEQCVESKAYMRANHMQLLTAWRDEVVRDGERVYEAKDGEQYEKSLTKTCMACHAQADADGKSTSAATYCLDCHAYVGVDTYCWNCHVDPAATGDKEGK